MGIPIQPGARPCFAARSAATLPIRGGFRARNSRIAQDSPAAELRGISACLQFWPHFRRAMRRCNNPSRETRISSLLLGAWSANMIETRSWINSTGHHLVKPSLAMHPTMFGLPEATISYESSSSSPNCNDSPAFPTKRRVVDQLSGTEVPSRNLT